MNEIIDLGDRLKLVYQEPDEYFNYYSIYYGQKYAEYFFRRSSAAMKEIVSIFDCGYFIMNNENIIGGVFIKPNFMADLFVVPPYKDYEGLVQKLLNHLKQVSNTEEKIIVRDVVEKHVTNYEQSGCQVNQVNYWMIRPTQSMKAILPGGYFSKPVLERNIADIVNLIIESYSGIQLINKSERKKTIRIT